MRVRKYSQIWQDSRTGKEEFYTRYHDGRRTDFMTHRACSANVAMFGGVVRHSSELPVEERAQARHHPKHESDV